MRSPSYMLRNGPFSRRRLETQFRTRRLFSGRSKSSHGVRLLRSVMLAGAQILPVIQADVTEKEA